MNFTIITVVYNGEKTIEETIKSVCSQSCIPNEYIIIDGNSTDETLNIVCSYQKKYSFIKYLSEKDNGIYDAMNKGIALSTGDWLCFMNADDRFSSNDVLQYIENEIIRTKNQFKLIYGIAKLIDNTLHLSSLKGRKVSLRDFFWDQPIVHQATFYKKELFEEVGNYNENLLGVGDYEWYVRFFYKFPNSKAHFVIKTIADFSMGGLTSEILWQNFCDRKKIAKKYFPLIINIKYFFTTPYYYLKFKILDLVKNLKIYRNYRAIKMKL
jgi:glycosyltransferase involved in cell wall biosynthesis